MYLRFVHFVSSGLYSFILIATKFSNYKCCNLFIPPWGSFKSLIFFYYKEKDVVNILLLSVHMYEFLYIIYLRVKLLVPRDWVLSTHWVLPEHFLLFHILTNTWYYSTLKFFCHSCTIISYSFNLYFLDFYVFLFFVLVPIVMAKKISCS